ncbi:class I SAM-dependent methyltransferase [Alisedimentitalea sp. MJ-SS2]|uniref:class I SAM-dependent methyltransferase n=1 Tax=Aliisedimentitalea sp. MJ-SS2 TaxID=3049795 RepID=UPI00290D332B|nr:class I SAM-dependent methyltransferase [Alisedimentitalea sp. MJ-SS2]MDU8928613.1 class I SAM-dependent methyltransferase [Alisedimentitalea sp. MJ-SS2]
MNKRDFLSIPEAMARSVGDIAGLDVIDIGCGRGQVTEELVLLGANATGIEPNPAFLQCARDSGRATFLAGTGEQTGLPDNAFGLAVFSESLHHAQDRFAAMKEAARIVKPGGRLVVIESEAPDPIYEVARYIDDEAPVYAEAQNAIAALVTSGSAVRAETLYYAAKYRGETAQDMLDQMAAVDGSRSLAPGDRPPYEQAFAKA